MVGREGETIRGRVVIDGHGDNVQATITPGDHFRRRHDDMKITLYNLCKWAGVPAEMEVYNLFSRLIPQRELARYESNRQRQAIIPDLRVVLQVGGLSTPVLHELKCISVSQSRYKPSWEERAVDRRANQLHESMLVRPDKSIVSMWGQCQERLDLWRPNY